MVPHWINSALRPCGSASIFCRYTNCFSKGDTWHRKKWQQHGFIPYALRTTATAAEVYTVSLFSGKARSKKPPPLMCCCTSTTVGGCTKKASLQKRTSPRTEQIARTLTVTRRSSAAEGDAIATRQQRCIHVTHPAFALPLLFQIVCGMTIGKLASGAGFFVTRVALESTGLEWSSARSSKSDSGRALNSSATKSEKRGREGGPSGRYKGGRKAQDKHSVKRVVGGGAVEIRGGKYGEIEEESFHRHYALQTPLQQVGRL